PASGEDIAKLKQLRKLATALVGGDPSNVPACHPIRWAGSWGRKATPPRLCKIISPAEHLDNEIDLDTALAILQKAAGNGRGTESACGRVDQVSAFAHLDPDKGYLGEGIAGPLDLSEAVGEIITGKQFHPVLVPLAASLAARGSPEPVTRGLLRALLDNTR